MPETCVWTVEDTDGGVWKPSCGGDLFMLETGTPAHNHMRYCCYCGLRLEAVRENVDRDEPCPTCDKKEEHDAKHGA